VLFSKYPKAMLFFVWTQLLFVLNVSLTIVNDFKSFQLLRSLEFLSIKQLTCSLRIRALVHDILLVDSTVPFALCCYTKSSTLIPLCSGLMYFLRDDEDTFVLLHLPSFPRLQLFLFCFCYFLKRLQRFCWKQLP
jgi:hypothetical protein